MVVIIACTITIPLDVIFALRAEGTWFDNQTKKLAIAITKSKSEPTGRTNTWSRQEVYRGWIAGVILLIGSVII